MALFRMIRRNGYWRIIALIAIGALFMPSNAFAEPKGSGDWLNPTTEVGIRIAQLYDYIYYIAIAVFVIVEGLLFYAVFRYRFKAGREQQIVPQVHGNTTLEVTWTAIPALIVAGLFVLTFNTMAYIQQGPDSGSVSLNPNHVVHNAQPSLVGQAPAGALQVIAIGHQWWWEFRYPELGITTASIMHVPAGRPIEVLTRSEDVIHSWWAPQISGKVDAVPGVTNATWFRADEPLAEPFHAQCAEFCGDQHAVMQFRVKVDSQADFDAWAANQAKPAPVIADAAAKRGEGLFATKSCVGCHAITGHPDRNANLINKKIGPNLTHYNTRSFLAGGALENTPENLARWLRNPDEVKSGNLMSSVVKPGYLTEQEVQDLVAYLRTLN